MKKDTPILITGGAGFIGSNIVDKLVADGFTSIKVLDNLETGYIQNIQDHIDSGKIHFIRGDITDMKVCSEACKGIEIVLHQAAMGSVPRSIEFPMKTFAVNVTGFMNMLESCRIQKVERFVYASSSSVYGDDTNLPKVEELVGNPLSPYAVSKKTNELFARTYADLYKMEIIGLRYFNVFGPKQNPEGPYAAVIPIFINNILKGKDCNIYGDGNNRRDFTFIDNVVQANLLAAFTENKDALNQIYNIAYGATKSVNDLFEMINAELKSSSKPKYLAPRIGEIKDSFASIEKAKKLFNYNPEVSLEKGIIQAVDWYRKNLLSI